MTARWHRIQVLAALVLAATVCGCAGSKQQARKQAVAHWQEVRTGVNLQMAQTQLDKGQTEQARDSLQEALRTNPNDAKLHLMLGQVLFELRDLNGAQAALSRARNLAPDLAEADYWQGVLAQSAGQMEEAHSAYQAAAGKAQDSPEYLCALLETKLALGRSQETVALATSRFRDFPRDARLRMLAADGAAQLPDQAQAEMFYEQAITLDPANDEAKEGLAQILCMAGNYERAGSLLQGLQGRPGRKDLRPMLAACHLAGGRYEKAQQLYEACLAEDPDRVSIRLRLNEARLLGGAVTQARQDLQALLQRQGGDPQGWELLGHALALEGDLPQARQAYVRAGQCGGRTDQLQEFIWAIDVRSDAMRRTVLDGHAAARADNASTR